MVSADGCTLRDTLKTRYLTILCLAMVRPLSALQSWKVCHCTVLCAAWCPWILYSSWGGKRNCKGSFQGVEPSEVQSNQKAHKMLLILKLSGSAGTTIHSQIQFLYQSSKFTFEPSNQWGGFTTILCFQHLGGLMKYKVLLLKMPLY